MTKYIKHDYKTGEEIREATLSDLLRARASLTGLGCDRGLFEAGVRR